MSDTYTFAAQLSLIAAVGLAAVVAGRLTAWLRVPTPALVLIAAAIAVKAIPALHPPDQKLVEHLVSVALLCILFDGGMHIGWRRFRANITSIAVIGVLGTLLTALGTAAALHFTVGLNWYASLLVATAVAPTDPAVVFSVLGRREISGRAGTVLEGESGANDPVGIALMISLISAGGLSGGAVAHIAVEFALQMGVGLAIGLLGGYGLVLFMRRFSLPSEGLYPLRTLACALAIFGVATLAHGSGFLAVFLAGIIVGDARAPYKVEIERFHSALASLAEVVAFVVLGLTVDLDVLSRTDVWLPGLLIGAALAFLIRPALVSSCLIGSGLARNERAFILFAGLKGAVPILLGTLLLGAAVPAANRLYGIVVVVVVFSVVVQGTLVPSLAQRLRVPMRILELKPWALGVRLVEEPDGVHRVTVAAGSRADGRRIADLDELPDGAWVSVVVRAGELLAVHGDTPLQAGDQALVLADPHLHPALSDLFEGPSTKV